MAHVEARKVAEAPKGISKMKDEKEPRLQEVTETILETESAQDCSFCSLLCQGKEGKGLSQSPSLHFMTEREIRVLASMRRLKEDASETKRRMRRLEQEGVGEDRADLSGRLAGLRAEWRKMDKERLDAAEERMRLLGHVQ